MKTTNVLLILFVSFSLTSCSFPKMKETEVILIPEKLRKFEVPDPIPQPKSGKGSVTGQVFTNDPQDLIGLIIYLGELIPLPENMYGAYLDTKTAPSSLISIENGKFYFKDVEPGIYSLIIYEVIMGGRVYQDSNGSAIPIKVIDGEITNTGRVEFYFSREE